MKKKVIIDYLNLTSVFYIIKNDRHSDVIVLMKSESKFLELLFIKILNFLQISYKFEEMIFAKLPQNPTSIVLKKNERLAKQISEKFYSNSSLKIDNVFNFTIDESIYYSLWRLVSLEVYASLYYKDINKIYISAPLNIFLLRKYFKSECIYESLIEVSFYSAIGRIKDYGYAFRKKKYPLSFLGERISRVLYFLRIIFLLSVSFKKNNHQIDALLFSHDQKKYKWLGVYSITDYLNFKFRVVLPDNIVGNGKDKFKANSVNWKKIGSYYVHMFIGVKKFSWAFKVSLDLFNDLLIAWKYSFFIKNLYKTNNVKLVFAAGFESVFFRAAIAIASDSKEMISLDSTSSLGEYPTESCGSWRKFTDRFFVWGRWHYDLAKASKDNSSGYIISGYLYDDRISIMHQEGKLFKKEHTLQYKHIITIFDTTIDQDHSFSGDVIFRYIDSILDLAKEFNALVVLKTKKNNSGYEKLIQSHENVQIIIHDEYGSLVSSLVSDLVIGLSASTPAAISSTYGKNVIFYDPSNVVWSKWIDHSLPTVIHTLDELKIIARRVLLNPQDQETFNLNSLDPFADGKSQYRIANYMNNVFDNLYLGKNIALDLADENYMKEWGDDKVILN
jgi:hypothetical protein